MNAWQITSVGLVSLAVALLVVLTRRWHQQWTGDFEDSGVQKHHRGSPPRIGLVPLICGVGLGVFFLGRSSAPHAHAAADTLGLAVLASLPVVLLGLADDLTKKVTPRARLLGAAAAASLAIALLGSTILRTDVPLLDSLLGIAPLSVLLTLLMVCGFTNAMNIVDGLNGLAGGLVVLMLTATGVVAAQLGDTMIVQLCLVLGLAVCGFLVVNFPRGLMFLGDGGAYFIGFLLAQVWILLLNRNPSVTPWFVMAVAFLPTMETIFSIYRRRLHRARNKGAMAPDRLHLHSLVYRRRVREQMRGTPWVERWVANALASTIVLMFGAVPIVLALFAPASLLWNLAVLALASIVFLTWIKGLIHFRHAKLGADGSVRRLHRGETGQPRAVWPVRSTNNLPTTYPSEDTRQVS